MDKNTTYQTGNTAATKFESLVNRLYVSLCFAANRFLGDKTAAQDIVQEAFARLWFITFHLNGCEPASCKLNI